MLRILLDEDTKSSALVRLLVQSGHDVVTTTDLGLDGKADSEVLDAARIEGRVVITQNCADYLHLHNAVAKHVGIFLIYYEGNSRMSYERIVRSIDNLEQAGVPISGHWYALNDWQY